MKMKMRTIASTMVMIKTKTTMTQVKAEGREVRMEVEASGFLYWEPPAMAHRSCE
jgi:hypothetical protein